VLLTSGFTPRDLSAHYIAGSEFQLVGKPYRRAQLAEVIRATLASAPQVAATSDPTRRSRP
jgi:hypothetical protein